MTHNKMPGEERRVWVTLLSKREYLEGCLTLWYSLKWVGSKYPLIVMYTNKLEQEAHDELDRRGIEKHPVQHLQSGDCIFECDTRFNECWTKLQVFSLAHVDKAGLVDADMVVVKNMDELFEIPLNRKNAVLAASHACVCNPYKKPNYPANWIPENCAFSEHHYFPINDRPEYGPACDTGLAKLNGGLLMVQPNPETMEEIYTKLLDVETTRTYKFPDQDLLADLYKGRWVPLSYKYNALKPMRNIHKALWKDDEVKNIHYIMGPKPWEFATRKEAIAADKTGTFSRYWDLYEERLKYEQSNNFF